MADRRELNQDEGRALLSLADIAPDYGAGQDTVTVGGSPNRFDNAPSEDVYGRGGAPLTREDAIAALMAGAGPGSSAYQAYYGSPTSYYNQSPSVQAARQQSFQSPQTIPNAVALSNPSYTSTPGYNPLNYADDATARRVADLTGGTVRRETYEGSPINMPGMNMVNIGGQDNNAGLLAHAMSQYSPEYIARTYGIPVGGTAAGQLPWMEAGAGGMNNGRITNPQDFRQPTAADWAAITTGRNTTPSGGGTPGVTPNLPGGGGGVTPITTNPYGQPGVAPRVVAPAVSRPATWSNFDTQRFVPSMAGMQDAFRQAFPNYGNYFGNQQYNYGNSPINWLDPFAGGQQRTGQAPVVNRTAQPTGQETTAVMGPRMTAPMLRSIARERGKQSALGQLGLLLAMQGAGR